MQEAKMDGIYPVTSVILEEVNEDPKGNFTEVKDQDGTWTRLIQRGARSSLFLYLNRTLPKEKRLTRPEIWELLPKKREAMMNSCVDLLPKGRIFQLIRDQDGKIKDVVTEQHQQIPYSEIRQAVEEAITKVIPGATFFDRGVDRFFTFSLPVESKYVKSWVGIDAGVNRPRGRCAIYIYTKMEVVWRGSEGTRSPCHNWAFWGKPGSFFGIDLNRFPLPDKYAKLTNLTSKAIHVRGTEIQTDDISKSIEEILDASSVIDPIIEDAMNVQLHQEEMAAIIEAYRQTVGLPDYLAEMIINNVMDMDLWGLSNAISYVRTHGELKKSKTDNREERSIIPKLENMAGELLSLGPTIKEIKKRIPGHRLTLEILLNPSEAIYSKKAKEALEKA